jgi:hypothetical protein
MKSNRAKATSAHAFPKSNKPDFSREALSILKNLERARNYGSKRKYNKELDRLVAKHPEFKDSILSLRWQ